jgi:hypothetical protein
MTKLFKIFLTLWLCLGTAISGYFFINRYPENYIFGETGMRNYGVNISNCYRDSYFETSLLITLVGSIFIIGIGFAFKKK